VPTPISFSDERYSDSDPWLTPDGRTLYFISDRPAPGRNSNRTDYDIWRATRTVRGWSSPERLGPEVNGAGQELGPELHQARLYFSSARRSGAGGLDIYQARQDGSGFETATRLEGPFNTPESESDFTLSPDGKSAMFWRSLVGRGTIHIAYAIGSGWSQPVPLPEGINAGPFNFTPSFSADGNRIRYASTFEREGQASGLADIYEARLPRR
jgi:Tol biopolymer transport system component